MEQKTVIEESIQGPCKTKVVIALINSTLKTPKVFDLEGEAVVGATISEDGNGSSGAHAFIVGANTAQLFTATEAILQSVIHSLDQLEGDEKVRAALYLANLLSDVALDAVVRG